MNFFYGINANFLKSEIQIPTFQNRNLKKTNLKLFKSYPENKKWVLKEVLKNKINDYFYIIKNDDFSNKDIFFLADESIFDKFNNEKLENYNNYTDTSPAFRANLKIYINHGGFSSYQSEYPYSMITKKGTIMSPIASIANSRAEKNYVFIKNIFNEPIEDIFKVYLVNYKLKKIEEQFEIKTNYTNFIEINKQLIKPEVFLVTDRYLGIPMYVSIKNNFLSFEHTLPPHEYILNESKFFKTSNLKKEINEIIS
tara:strand:+ start:722 stop:1483 length:762 start_codon:yes stop_codon:yes gene_type:complete